MAVHPQKIHKTESKRPILWLRKLKSMSELQILDSEEVKRQDTWIKFDVI